jgi:phytoene desaturase
VKEILSLVAFFLGDTPFRTPAVYTLLSYTELKHDGYHNVRGGMYQIVTGLLRELEKKGVSIQYNTQITGFIQRGNKIDALVDSTGKNWKADVYVINSDAATFRGTVFQRKGFSPERLDRMHWTMAPLTLYLGLDRKLPELHHHHYFLGNNFQEYAGKIFRNQISLEQPYYYVNTISRSNPESAPPGGEALFILCPVPHKLYKPDWSDSGRIAEGIVKDLSQRTGIDLSRHIVSKTVIDPDGWEKAFGLYRGSGLGLAHDLNQIGAFRPANHDEQFRNVYYTGASTVPGTGLPMAVISSRLVAERILG